MNSRNLRLLRLIVLASFGIACCSAQSSQTPARPANSPTVAPGQVPPVSGLESPWDVKNIIAALVKDNEQLKTLIANLNPQQWYDKKGAPSTYVLQWTTAQRQVNDVVIATRALSARTESLSLALDTYFRLEALDTSARSLDDGAHKYGDRAAADRLSELIARNFTNRERFRDYLRDLASSKEQDFKIADEEAQRCRGIISREPPASARRSKSN